jgi:MoaA/NifB/PqqE/SkfB family radical SAM enzyme
VNTTCDLRCRICYLPNFTEGGVSIERARAIADEIVNAGTLYVCLLGGEFLLREDAVDLVRRLREADVYVKIITNGQTLTRELAGSLAAAGLNQVEVSFDGLSVEQHERSRGRGTWDRARAAIAHARDAGIPRGGIVLTVHSENQEELVTLPEFLDAVGVNECYLSPFKKAGKQGARASWNPPDRPRLSAAISMMLERRPDLSVTLLPSCSCGRTSVVVGHDEGIRTCSFSYNSVGSLREQSLRDVWHSLNDRVPGAGPVGFCTVSKLRVVS